MIAAQDDALERRYAADAQLSDQLTDGFYA